MESVTESSIQEKILAVIGSGDMLFIVPPFVTTKTTILGPLILQSLARQLGYNTQVLHLNLLLASILGIEVYESISYGQPFRMSGERLFARSAYGLPPLGKSPELCLNPAKSVFGNNQAYLIEEFEYKYYNISDSDLDTFLKIENLCKSFIEEVSQTIASLKYNIVGCSTNWEQNNCCIALINRLKEIQPDILTLIGGSNCEGDMAEGIASLSDAIDYVFSGEGETAFTNFLKSYAAGKLPSQGILVGRPVADLDSIPLPDYESYLNQKQCFFGENFPEGWAIGYETSRGCWWGKCYFCGLNGTDRVSFRKKTVKKALGDFDRISQRYPHRRITMVDKVMPVSYEEELLPLLSEEKENSPIDYGQRSNLNLKSLIHLKNAKMHEIQPGIEALSTGLLQLMNKGVTVKQNLLLLRNARSVGISVIWNLLWGFPKDTVEHYEETLKILPAIRHLYPPIIFRHICIDRFSPYFKMPQEHQISNLRPWAVYKNIYPGWAAVDKIAYRFIGDYPCAAHDHPELIQEIAREVTLWQKLWKGSSLMMVPFGDFYMIYDNREGNGKGKTHVVDDNQAKEIMTSWVYNKSENLQWAVEQKLGIVVDSWYVPLVTASAELLLEFEENRSESF